jgi:hypothetical protein
MRGVEAEAGKGVLSRAGGRKKRSREAQGEEDVAERRRERAATTKKKAREQPEEEGTRWDGWRKTGSSGEPPADPSSVSPWKQTTQKLACIVPRARGGGRGEQKGRRRE